MNLRLAVTVALFALVALGAIWYSKIGKSVRADLEFGSRSARVVSAYKEVWRETMAAAEASGRIPSSQFPQAIVQKKGLDLEIRINPHLENHKLESISDGCALLVSSSGVDSKGRTLPVEPLPNTWVIVTKGGSVKRVGKKASIEPLLGCD